MSRRLGQPFMPWQDLVATVGGELLPNGLPAYREVIVTVPRQSGKTTLVLSWECQRCIGWQHLGPQRVAYSAQTGNDARKKLIEDQVPLLERPGVKKALAVRRILRGMGNEAVEFLNGSRIVLLASSEDSGHGKTIDLGIKDEFFADVDGRRDQALVPAMATRRHAQSVTTSTAGTEESEPLNAAIARGRQAVEQGLDTGTAYFEWSADEDDDPDDPAVWWGCMPALGYTITEEVVRHARATLDLAEFRRAFLNITDGRRGDPIIPRPWWVACHDPESRPVDPVCIAFDVSPDRATGSIAAAAPNPTGDWTHVEVIENRPGTLWLPGRIAEIADRNRPTLIVCDSGGPAAALLPQLEALRVDVRQVTTREHVQACGAFYDDVRDRKLRHIGQPALNAAVDGADRREVTDAWLWSRKLSSVDISPLVAATLARWASKTVHVDVAESVW